jgi:hypothetical protein
MGLKPGLFIDAMDDHVSIMGRKEIVRKATDLSACSSRDVEDFVVAEIYDPVPKRSCQEVNAVFRDRRMA